MRRSNRSTLAAPAWSAPRPRTTPSSPSPLGRSSNSSILEQISSEGCTTLQLRRELAASAFASTAAYDRAIADYFLQQTRAEEFPETLGLLLSRKAVLRYGENPHQSAALYRVAGERGANLVSARQLNGKQLSYNNLLDLDSALAIARAFDEPGAAVIKHNNPCGAATAPTLAQALQKALDGDPVSAFGSVLGLNRTVDVATAEILTRPGLFIEAMVAPRLRGGRRGRADHQAQMEGRTSDSCRWGCWTKTPPRGICGTSTAGCWCRTPTWKRTCLKSGRW